jgi:hypothetical protein
MLILSCPRMVMMGWVSSSSGLVAGVPRSTVCPGKADSAFDSPHNMYTVYVAMDDSVNDRILSCHHKLPLSVSYLTGMLSVSLTPTWAAQPPATLSWSLLDKRRLMITLSSRNPQ